MRPKVTADDRQKGPEPFVVPAASEWFEGRFADVLKTNRFTNGEDLEQTLMRYVALYNHQLPQSALKSKTPMRAMKDWYASHPHLFVKRPNDHPECDN